jgi:hypothetical protein
MSQFSKIRQLSIVPKRLQADALPVGKEPALASGVSAPGIPESGVPVIGTPQPATPGPSADNAIGSAFQNDSSQIGTPISPTPHTGAPIIGTPDSATPIIGTPQSATPDPSAEHAIGSAFQNDSPQIGTPVSRIPRRGIPVSGTPGTRSFQSQQKEAPRAIPWAVSGTPFSGTLDKAVPVSGVLNRIHTPLRIRQATLAQDGHSLGEQALYESLWERAQPFDKDGRIITIGYRQMSQVARLTVNNCKANIFSLIDKLAVEEVAAFTFSQGRTYKVFSYTAILQRRKAAGLIYYVKSRGVTFVDPERGNPITNRNRQIGPPEPGTPELGIPRLGAPEEGRSGTPLSGELGAPHSDTYLNRQEARNSFSNSTTTVRSLLQTQLPTFDNAAVDQLWTDCRLQVPDVSAEEIDWLFGWKLPESRARGIENPNGFLLRAVARSCTPAAINAMRQGRESAKEIQMNNTVDSNTQSIEEDLAAVEKILEAMPGHPQADEWRQTIERLRALKHA